MKIKSAISANLNFGADKKIRKMQEPPFYVVDTEAMQPLMAFETTKAANSFLELAKYMAETNFLVEEPEDINKYEIMSQDGFNERKRATLYEDEIKETQKVVEKAESPNTSYVCLVNTSNYEIEGFYKSMNKAAKELKTNPTALRVHLLNHLSFISKTVPQNYILLFADDFNLSIEEDGSYDYNPDDLKEMVDVKLDLIKRRAMEASKYANSLKNCLINIKTGEIKEENIYNTRKEAALALGVTESRINTYVRQNTPIKSLEKSGYVFMPVRDLNVDFDDEGRIIYDKDEMKKIAQEKLKKIKAFTYQRPIKEAAKKDDWLKLPIAINTKTLKAGAYSKDFLLGKFNIDYDELVAALKSSDYFVVNDHIIITKNGNLRDENGNLDNIKCNDYIKILRQEIKKGNV